MKQRIAVEQLMDLTEEQKQKLREWWKPQEGDFFLRVTTKGKIDFIPFIFNAREFEFANYKEFKIPLLSMGQMIELLHTNHNLEHIEYMSGNGTYEVTVNPYVRLIEYKQAVELCDALWEAVKEIL